MTKEELRTDESKYIIELVIKDKLRKEAEEWLCNNLHSASEEDFIKAMVDIAEPREKRIAELEHQLTHRNCIDCSNHSSKLRMRTLELEKENERLTDELKALRESIKDYGAGCYENGLRNGRRQVEAQIEKMKCCGNCAKNGHICVAEEMQGKLCGKNKDKWELRR